MIRTLHHLALILFLLGLLPTGYAGDVGRDFAAEEITPYIKIMQGPWVGNTISGTRGRYRVDVQVPRETRYILGLFDTKVGRTGADQRSAVVLVDGVNPRNPAEKVALADLDSADVSRMSKVPLDGLSYTAQDVYGRDCSVKVVDAKEEYELGPVKPFSIPSERSGPGLARLDIFIFAGPALPPNPGETVEYGLPLVRYTVVLAEQP